MQIAFDRTGRPTDIGRIKPTSQNGRQELLAIMAGGGFDAAMARDAANRLRRGWASRPHLVSAVKHLRGSSMRVQPRVDGAEPAYARARTVVMGNVVDGSGLPAVQIDETTPHERMAP
jgi:diacylglycerol kinase family enzyme